MSLCVYLVVRSVCVPEYMTVSYVLNDPILEHDEYEKDTTYPKPIKEKARLLISSRNLSPSSTPSQQSQETGVSHKMIR